MPPQLMQAWETEVTSPAAALLARQWCRSAADAEDILHDAYLRLRAAGVPPSVQLRAYVLTCVRRCAIDRARQSARRDRRERAAALPEAWFASAKPQAQEADARLQAALEALPLEQREALALRVWGELPFAQVAAITGVPLATATSRCRLALDRLRRALAPAGPEAEPVPIQPRTQETCHAS